MDARKLRSIQAPLKARFREEPEAARITLKATGRIFEDEIVCRVVTARAEVKAGLHPASGGNKQTVCSGDMLLEALAACAGVTLKAVATALDIDLRSGIVRAEGDLDFRGALGVGPEVAVGFSDVRLRFELDTDATPAERDRLIELTERYCVVYQTLRRPPQLGLETYFVTPEAAEEARLQALRLAMSHGL
jgi:uncharacterized OsmC-like protein